MNLTVELVLKHKNANMRKSELLMLEALKSAPHLNDKYISFGLHTTGSYVGHRLLYVACSYVEHGLLVGLYMAHSYVGHIKPDAFLAVWDHAHCGIAEVVSF
jgi:hypothetical protein